jgi:hypothetical protein
MVRFLRVENGEDAYLDLSGRHLEFFGKLLAPGRVGFLVGDEDALKDLKLGRGGALAGLDSVGNVGVEHLRVDLGGIHAGWNEGGNVRAMEGGRKGRGRRGGRVGRVANQHSPFEGEERERERRSEMGFEKKKRKRDQGTN